MLDVKNLSVVYGDGTTGIKDLSLHLTQGEKCALIGANGAGKTTLLLALVGALSGNGQVNAAGVTLSKQSLSELRQRVGLVLQNPDDQLFLPTIARDVAFGPENLGLDRETVRHKTQAMLEQMGIAHLGERSALRLSGGEKRMAALAAVLVMEPQVLLLDEPTAFLDPKARRRLIKVLQGLSQTMLIATHDLSFALEVCPETVLLRKGMVFARGSSRELLFDDQRMEAGGVESLPVFSGLQGKTAAE